MPFSDVLIVLKWWLSLFAIGLIFLPITTIIFFSFIDRGYIFAKILGVAIISYVVFVLGFLKILPFTETSIILISVLSLISNIVLISKYPGILMSFKSSRKIFLFEEIIFLGVLFFWSFIHAHAPDIHGLEKYMDYGFINSILRNEYLPPLDIWLTPFYINYYYFGHLVTAVLTKLSFLPPSITFNLMLSTITAFTFVGAFSIGANLIFLISKRKAQILFGGLLTGLIVTFAGNLHSIYLFFKPYANENPVPFWQLAFSLDTFPNSYWYPNATRFIHNTIHEFPIYSSVVSDLHGHFLDIPFVLLTIAILLSLINSKHETRNSKQIQNINAQNSKRFGNFNFGDLKLFRISDFGFRILLLGFILAIMYMTNAWDGIIYFLLSAIVIFIIRLKSLNNFSKFYPPYILHTTYYILLIGLGFFLFSLPFNLNFKPFASGIGILCSPKFLTDIGKFGPFLFEVDHCQHSSIWQLFILYGFFYFWVFSFVFFIYKKLKTKLFTLDASDIFVFLLIILSTLLIIIPELIYVKDIYPAHYRANTMFKLVYQSFIMLSLASGYIIIRIVSSIKYYVLSIEKKIFYIVYLLLATCYIILVFLYPYFAINSYFGDLKTYYGLDGTTYLKALYPTDYEAISWINTHIKNQPVILEAQGDSYTDYGRISTHTGLPTVLGWTVHEWLWRGTYDVPSPRIEEVKHLYEEKNLQTTKKLIEKYKIKYIFIGDLEQQKYPNLNEAKFKSFGKIVYQNNTTKIYQLTSN